MKRAGRFLDHRVWMIGVGILIMGLTVVGFSTLSMTFEPEQDNDNSTIRIGMPPGSTLARTKGVATRAADVVEQDPNVEAVFERSFTGAAFLNVIYKESGRSRASRSSANWPRALRRSPTLVSTSSARAAVPCGGGRPITLFLGGNDPEQLAQIANQVSREMESIPVLVAPRVQGDNVRPEIIIKPRFDLAADLGVSTAALASTIRIATIGDIAQNSARFSLADRQVPIIVSLDQAERRDIATLENLPVPTASGGSVPLKSVAEISFGSGPISINRTNQLYRLRWRGPHSGHRQRRCMEEIESFRP
jgi:multidrug efflux pump subunit AcrB